MTNRIDLPTVVDTILALSALKNIDHDPTLPGPYGRHEEAALRAIAAREFEGICAELGYTPEDDSTVDLPTDCHELLQCVLTDRSIAAVSTRTPRADLIHRLRCRLRPLPPKRAKGY